MTDYATSMLKCSTRFRTLPILQEALPLMQHGSSDAFAQSLVDIFAEVGQGLCEAEPRTPKTTTPSRGIAAGGERLVMKLADKGPIMPALT